MGSLRGFACVAVVVHVWYHASFAKLAQDVVELRTKPRGSR